MDEDTFDSVIDAFTQAEPKFIEDDTPVTEEDDQQEEVVEEDEGSDDDDATDDTDTSDEEGEGDEDGDDDQPDSDDDDPEVDIPVDGEVHKAKVSELKRLYGQEASLTKKSQAVAEQNRLLEAQGLYLSKLYDTRLEAARARAEKYRGVDIFKAYRELEEDEFVALKEAKEAAEAELAVVESEASSFVKKVHETKTQYLRQQAMQSLPTIKQAIPEWDDKVYNDVRTYAVSQGMDSGFVNEIVDASAIIMMHKAMRFDELQRKAGTVKKKADKAPKKTAPKGDNGSDTGAQNLKRLKARAASTGDIDDVAAAFMAAHAN